jgi:hypothetical protein
LANLLQQDRYSAAAENSLHQHNLSQITSAFASANIPSVLLKGAAVAESIPGGWETRTMSDVDFWLQEDNFARSGQVMRKLGFSTAEKESRPRALQKMSGGEIQFFKRDWQKDLIEFHLSPFKGWWLTRTAAIDKQAIWSRIEPLEGWDAVFQLSLEDTVIHIAVHMAVNHQCGLYPLRSLLDIAQITIRRPVSWDLVVLRAKQMRVGTAVWLVLYLLQQLVGTPGLEDPLKQLEPSAWQQRSLQRIISPETILLGTDISSGRLRFLYLLLLVDRQRDMNRLVWRTIWPEKEWLLARYGDAHAHRKHLVNIFRYGQV